MAAADGTPSGAAETASGDVGHAVRHSLRYGIAMGLRRVASFLMIPVYTRWLNPGEYGTLELFNVALDMVALVLGMGLTQAVFRFYAQARTEEEGRRVISTIMLLLSGLYLVGALGGMALAPYLAEHVFGGVGFTRHVQIIFMSLVVMGMTHFGLAGLQTRHRSMQYMILSLTQLVLQLSLIGYLLVFREMGVLGVLYANFITFGLMGAYMLYVTWRECGLRVDWVIGRALLRYSIPLLGENVCAFTLAFADRFFLSQLRSVSELGIYALGYKLGMVMIIISLPFMTYWEAERFRVARRPGAAGTFRRYFTYFMFLLLFLAVGLSTLSRDAVRIMADAEFHTAYRVVPLIAAAYTIHIAAN